MTRKALQNVIAEDLRMIAGDGLAFESLRGKTILVTGANGFLPAYLVEALLHLNESRKLGLRVIGLVRSPEKAKARFASHLSRPDFSLDTQSLLEPLRFSGPIDVIVHAASQASPKFYGIDPVGTLAPNVLGTYRLLELAREKKSSDFLFFSSSEVYGQSAQAASLEENSYGVTDCMKVRSCYAESKRMGETMCVSWAHQYGVPVKVVRPFHIYGPGMASDDGRVFADFVADIVANRNIVMKSDGSAVRAYCYLADATRAFLTVLLNGQHGEAYNVGNPAAQASVLELAERLVRLFPERKLRVERITSGGGNAYLSSPINRLGPNVSKLESLGWHAVTGLDEGFRRTVESYL